MTVLLETERLVLRRFTPDDLDDLVALHNDPEVMFFINAGAPSPPEEVRGFLNHCLARYERGDGYGIFAAVEKSTSRFLGWFHLRPGEGAGPDEPELGYRLVRSAWGQGFGTEGSIALVEKAFADLGATKVYAEAIAVNTASRRVMEKAGMRLVRTFQADWPVRIPGDEYGDVEYAITRQEWTAAVSAGRYPAFRGGGQPGRQ
jgi:RimJ/RimL family protein N-acetyltransferase